jgi:chemotaxis regulatin CheY-phosphate phosphatase CheZ
MPLTEADYEAIEAAVMETNRGRWFLAEYARRNRHADTNMLLAAIERIEATMRGERHMETVDRIRFDLVDMANAIARAKAEIAAIKPDARQAGKFGEATEELDSIVNATEAATSEILAAAERIQEIAWTLREQSLDAEVCDLIDAKATEIYTACSFQDLTGQRSRKVIQALRYLEGRINAMIDIWGPERATAAETTETAPARKGEAALLNGPARPGDGLDQADIDVVMAPPGTSASHTVRDDGVTTHHRPIIDAAPAADAAATDTTSRPIATTATPGKARHHPLAEAPSRALARAIPQPAASDALTSRHAREPHAASPGRHDPQARSEKPSPNPAHDPLAPVMALSAEERIALFS